MSALAALIAREALTAFNTKEAVAAVPNNEPVIPPEALIEPVTNNGPVLISTVPNSVCTSLLASPN